MRWKKLLSFAGALLGIVSSFSSHAKADDRLQINADRSSVFNISVIQNGSNNKITIGKVSANGILNLKGYGKNAPALKQEGSGNTLILKNLSSKSGATVGVTQEGKGNEISFGNVSSKTSDVELNIKQDGNYNVLKTLDLGGVSGYGKVKFDVQQSGNNNKILINSLNATNGDVNVNITMANSGNDDNLIGGIDQDKVKDIDPDSKSLDDVDKYLQFSYQTGIYMKGDSVNLNAYINGTGNKVGIYQVAESGKAEADVNIGKNTPSSYNTVLIYQKANPGTDAFARVNVEGDGRTVKVYQTGETYADVDVKSTYSGSAPIIIKQKNYAPDAPNDVKVTFK